jgi:predicted TIM-barrel fold metal-dependent hydrolase
MTLPQRFIALEEHCITPKYAEVMAEYFLNLDYVPATHVQEKLLDVADARIAAMDELGIDVQVLSQRSPGAQLEDGELAISVARRVNDDMAAAIDRHPTRFAGFATVPLSDPVAAAEELRRCVEQLGFKGVLVNGRAGGEFLDYPEFDPILRAAAELEVPLFLHPAEPKDLIKESYYNHLQVPEKAAPAMESLFSTGMWGWHVETGTHAIRMILGGVFDRYPDLQVILGHWGELVPYYIGRIDTMVRRVDAGLRRRAMDYLNENFYVTPSGLETVPPLQLCLSVMGADRIMYATDYPFLFETRGRAFIDEAPISDGDKAKIAHLNAERLLRLPS